MVRIKRVFSRADEVIEKWLESDCLEDYRCSNVFSAKDYGETVSSDLYSYGYHYKLAKKINNKYMAINNAGYSVTTSKHISNVSYLARNAGYTLVYFQGAFIADNQITYNLEKIKETAKKLIKARSMHVIERYNSDIEHLKDQNKLLKLKAVQNV